MIPAGLCRRVNTFFSQARNSLAGERVQQKGREDGRRGRKSKKGKRRGGRGGRGRKKLFFFFLVALFPFSLVFYFLLNCAHRWPRDQLPRTRTRTAVSLKQIGPMAALHRGHVKSADCLNHISPALASV